MILFTGFPGFLGSELLPRALARGGGAGGAVCLVQPKFAALARERLAGLAAQGRIPHGSVRIAEGDITRSDLGLRPDYGALATRVTEIFHLAAVYDLAVSRDIAMRVNVDGTRHVLRFAAACRSLRRLHYASTCYVSGRYPGLFREPQLVEGQRFNNFYEETKYLAEVLVRERLKEGLPATIYRPAIVVGDSRTGATQKYDGPYCTIRWLLRQPRVTVLPLPIRARMTPLNVVPCDFVLDAMDHLAGLDSTVGKTYQLADPHPLELGEMIRRLGRIAGRTVLLVPVPLGVARVGLSFRAVSRRAPIPPEMLDYTVQPALYDTSETEGALAGSGISCPRFSDYAARLVDFVRAHPEIGAAAMV